MQIVVSLCIEFITHRYFIDSGSRAVTQVVCTCVQVSVCSNQPLTCLRAELQRQHIARRSSPLAYALLEDGAGVMFLFLLQIAVHQKLEEDQKSNALQPVNICKSHGSDLQFRFRKAPVFYNLKKLLIFLGYELSMVIHKWEHYYGCGEASSDLASLF